MASSVVPDLYSLYHLTRTIPHDVYPSISPTNPSLALGPSQNTILITGGGTGIGLATAKYYALAGAETVIITGRRKDALEDASIAIREANPETTVYAMQADVSHQDSVQKLWKDVKERIGKVDVLVNNAGRAGNHTNLGEGNVEEWMDVLHTNLFGVYLMCDAYAASLAPTEGEEAEAEEGTVINVSSALAFINKPATSSYSLSKVAVTRFTELLHAERPNIRAFSVHPGIIHTTLSTFGPAAKDTVELAAGLNLYLASPRADFLRGRYTTANWDVDELEKHQGEIVESDMLKIKLQVGVGGYGAEGHVWKGQEVGAR